MEVTPSKRSSNSRSYRPPATPSSSSSKVPSSPLASDSSPKLALKFDGKVYRTLDKPGSYSRRADFLGSPDESVSDLESDKAARKRRAVQRDMLVARSTCDPSKEVSFDSSSDSDDEVVQLHTPTKTKHRAEKRKRTTPSKRTSSVKGRTALPQPLADLLSLHMSLESSLLLHLANEGGSHVASHAHEKKGVKEDEFESVISMPNLIDLIDLSKKMESGGKRLTEADLSRLLWVWNGCLAASEADARSMGFTVGKTRVSTPNGIVSTYGIGIELVVKTNPQLPKYELVPSSPNSSPTRKTPSSPSKSPVRTFRDGMSVVALWSSGTESRRNEFEARLRRWYRREKKSSRTSDASLLLVPKADLPSLVPAVPVVPSTPTPSPRKPKASSSSASLFPSSPSELPPAMDVFGPTIAVPSANTPSSSKTTKPKDRRQAMLDRIQAKANSRQAAYLDSISHLAEGSPTKKRLGNPSSSGVGGTGSEDVFGSMADETDGRSAWRTEQMDRYKRNAMLSRLPSIAEAIWMLFDIGSRRSMLMSEVASSVSKSSKSVLSEDEARESLRTLADLCPAFVQIKVLDQESWVSLRPGASLGEARSTVKAELARSSFLA